MSGIMKVTIGATIGEKNDDDGIHSAEGTVMLIAEASNLVMVVEDPYGRSLDSVGIRVNLRELSAAVQALSSVAR